MEIAPPADSTEEIASGCLIMSVGEQQSLKAI